MDNSIYEYCYRGCDDCNFKKRCRYFGKSRAEIRRIMDKKLGRVDMYRLIAKWMYFGNVFIGVGIIIGPEYIGLTIGNLFIGFEKVVEK